LRARFRLLREMAWNAAMSQPMNDRQRSVLMMDEYQHYAGEALMSRSDPFAEARKYKHVASQSVCPSWLHK
jgi:hypothetical protein